MKILHLSFSNSGGAGVAAANLAALQKSKGDYVTHVYNISGNLASNFSKEPSLFVRAVLDNWIISKKPLTPLLSLLRNQTLGNIDFPQDRFDVVHLHWPVGMLRREILEQLQEICQKIAITLHDDYSFTGGCHNSGPCSLYENGCQQCPIVRQPFRGLVSRAYEDKKIAMLSANISVMAPSSWLYRRAKQSPILKDITMQVVRNPIHTAFLTSATNGLSGSNSGKTFKLGFIASNIHDPNKGLAELISICSSSRHPIFLEVIGHGSPNSRKDFPAFVKFWGPKNPCEIIEIANHWDALVLPSKQETAPTVLIEMACLGIPSIALNTGSVSEMIMEFGFGEIIDERLSTSNLDAAIERIVSKSNSDRLNNALHCRRLFDLDSIYRRVQEIYTR